MLRPVILLVFAFFTRSVYAQGIGAPVRLNSVLGDTLTPEINARFQLLPQIAGFKWAVFFLEDDSLLNAKVEWNNDRGQSQDTVITPYGTLQSVSKKMETGSDVSFDSAKVELKDGTVLLGKVLGETEKEVMFQTSRFGFQKIERGQIEKIKYQAVRRMPDSNGTVSDPNQTRAFLMPTATTLPGGTGYVGDYELLFFNAAYGVADWLMINGGTVLFPLPADEMIFDYGAKIRLLEIPNEFALATGVQILGGGLIKDASGMAYAVGSVGDADRKLNLAIGDAFSGPGGAFIWGVSGDARVSSTIKIMAELWVFPHSSYTPLIVGVRFFGTKLAGDLGLLYPIGVTLGSPIGIPVASITYVF